MVVGACACLLVFAGTASASADVTVVGHNAIRGGGAALITLLIPNDSESRSTTAVSVELPTATPLIAVQMNAIPGWVASQRTIILPTPVTTNAGTVTQAVASMTWTAQRGSGLQPGSFGDFTFDPDLLPDAASLTFVITQTFDDHTTITWNQPERTGQTSAGYRPAPVLALTAPTAPLPAATTTGDPLAVALAIAAMVLAVLAAGLAIARRVRRPTSQRRTRSPAPAGVVER